MKDCIESKDGTWEYVGKTGDDNVSLMYYKDGYTPAITIHLTSSEFDDLRTLFSEIDRCVGPEPEQTGFESVTAIWWTTQNDAQNADPSELLMLPEYVQEQFDSRYGRPGRGRLWSDDRFGSGVSCDFSEVETKSEIASYKFDEAGGVVIRAMDIELIRRLPGVITDMKLNEI
jgi:hypothetical protein